MGLQLAFSDEELFYTRAQIADEIHQHDLSLREIDEKRLQLAAGLAENDSLQQLIMRRHRESCLRVVRTTKSRSRASRLIRGLRQRSVTN